MVKKHFWLLWGADNRQQILRLRLLKWASSGCNTEQGLDVRQNRVVTERQASVAGNDPSGPSTPRREGPAEQRVRSRQTPTAQRGSCPPGAGPAKGRSVPPEPGGGSESCPRSVLTPVNDHSPRPTRRQKEPGRRPQLERDLLAAAASGGSPRIGTRAQGPPGAARGSGRCASAPAGSERARTLGRWPRWVTRRRGRSAGGSPLCELLRFALSGGAPGRGACCAGGRCRAGGPARGSCARPGSFDRRRIPGFRSLPLPPALWVRQRRRRGRAFAAHWPLGRSKQELTEAWRWNTCAAAAARAEPAHRSYVSSTFALIAAVVLGCVWGASPYSQQMCVVRLPMTCMLCLIIIL